MERKRKEMNTRELNRLTSPRRAAGEIRSTGTRGSPAFRATCEVRSTRKAVTLRVTVTLPKKNERKCGDLPLGGRRRARGERAHLSWPDLLPGTAVVRWSEGEENQEL